MNNLPLSAVACTLALSIAWASTAAPVTIEPTQDQPAATQPRSLDPPDRYDFILTAGAWVPRALGEVGLGFDPDLFDLTIEESFELDNSEGIFNGEFTMLKNDKWQVDLNGFDFSTETSGSFEEFAQFGDLEFDPGDAYTASLDITSAALEVGYWQFDVCRIGEQRGDHECRVDLRFAPFFAMRYLDYEHHVEIPGEGSENGGGEWMGVLAGMNLQMRYRTPDSFPLIRTVEIGGSMAAGPAIGGDGGSMAHVRAGLTAYFNDHFGLTFGYRLIHFIVENDDYEVNGGLQGLFFGATVRF